MRAYLVVNTFLYTEKFSEIYSFLKNAAEKYDISLQIKTSGELLSAIGENAFLDDIEMPDFVIFWDKDIFLAKKLEKMGLTLYNCADCVEICDSKILTHIALAENNIPSPKTVIAPKTFEGVGYNCFDFLEKAANALGFPMVIKEEFGSFGQQVYLARNIDQAKNIISRLGARPFLMQSFVCSSFGKDLRINVVGNCAVCSLIRQNTEDFRSNITGGGKAQNYQPQKSAIDLAIRAAKAARADFCAVDMLFLDNGGFAICEINSNPHFKSSYDATGVNMADYIFEYIFSKEKSK